MQYKTLRMTLVRQRFSRFRKRQADHPHLDRQKARKPRVKISWPQLGFVIDWGNAEETTDMLANSASAEEWAAVIQNGARSERRGDQNMCVLLSSPILTWDLGTRTPVQNAGLLQETLGSLP